jgi:hypothetical protein
MRRHCKISVTMVTQMAIANPIEANLSRSLGIIRGRAVLFPWLVAQEDCATRVKCLACHERIMRSDDHRR